jgi:hypothetical protein
MDGMGAENVDEFNAALEGPASLKRLLDHFWPTFRNVSPADVAEALGDLIDEGIGVAIGARISALAGPGEVLVSSTVKDLVAGSGLRFEDRGEHQLKGIDEPWRVLALTGRAQGG